MRKDIVLPDINVRNILFVGTPSPVDDLVDVEIQAKINLGKLHAVTRNRLMKALTTGVLRGVSGRAALLMDALASKELAFAKLSLPGGYLWFPSSKRTQRFAEEYEAMSLLISEAKIRLARDGLDRRKTRVYQYNNVSYAVCNQLSIEQISSLWMQHVVDEEWKEKAAALRFIVERGMTVHVTASRNGYGTSQRCSFD